MVRFIKKFKEIILHRFPLIIFLFLYLLLSLLTYKDYGTTWDESDVYSRGIALYLHLQGELDPNLVDLLKINSNDVAASGNAIYNHIYPAANFFIADKVFNNTSFEIFHLLNMLFASLIYILAYEILIRSYKNKYLALLGPLFILITPRFLGDVPANPKDMPFAVLFFISLAFIYLLRSNKNLILKGFVLGILFGMSFNFRVIGITLFAIYILYNLYRQLFIFKVDWRIYFKNEFYVLLLISVFAFVVVLLTWPFIGANPIINTIEVLKYSKDFPWEGNVLFNGTIQNSLELPLYYIPLYILITTPLFIIVLSLLTPIIAKRRLKNELMVLMLLAIIINVALYFGLKPIVYDGLRHYLFLLPLLSFTASIGFIEILKRRNKLVRLITLSLLITNIILVFNQLIVLYPYQYIYFNELAGGLNGASKNFETDYWGATFKEAIYWLKENEFTNYNKTYSVNNCANPTLISKEIELFQDLGINVRWVPYEEAEYFICYQREIRDYTVNGELIHTVSRDNTDLNYIYKIIK